eukprot:g4587.t1
MNNFYTEVNRGGSAPQILSSTQLEKLKEAFQYNCLPDGSITIENIEKCALAAEVSLSGKDISRVNRLAALVTEGKGKHIRFDQLVTLLQNQIDVYMLYHLFDRANTNTSMERVEFFLDVDEMMALLEKLEVPVKRKHFLDQLDSMDKDADGRVDWEEFLTICSNLIGSYVNIGVHETKFNQLRKYTKVMDKNFDNTEEVVAKLHKRIEEKRLEIEKRLKDTTIEDIRGKLQTVWKEKDDLELELLQLKSKHFSEMKDVLMEQDEEKQQLVEEYRDAIEERDENRRKVDQIRSKFESNFSNHFITLQEIQSVMEEITTAGKQVRKGLSESAKQSKEMHGVWDAIKSFENLPKASTSEYAIEYLQKQAAIMGEISTKLEMMQRERDKYEEMITQTLIQNKSKRVECVTLNMKITDLETIQMQLEEKYKSIMIINMTLDAEVARKRNDSDSKQVKVLKNQVFQFEEELKEAKREVNESKKKIKTLDDQILKSQKKCAQLNIELGEMKIILEELVREMN